MFLLIKCLECREMWASLGWAVEGVCEEGQAVGLWTHSSLAHLFRHMGWGDGHVGASFCSCF
jgi:hypothetical protein